MSIHPNMYKKYVLMGEYIRSKSDGNVSWIGAHELCNLYGLNPNLCFFCDSRLESTYRGIDMKRFTILRPLYNGDYKEYLSGVQK